MSFTTSTTLSPLVAGAADLARKLAAYKATSNTASGMKEDDYTGEIIPSPLDVSIWSQSNEKNFLLFHKMEQQLIFIPAKFFSFSKCETKTPTIY